MVHIRKLSHFKGTYFLNPERFSFEAGITSRMTSIILVNNFQQIQQLKDPPWQIFLTMEQEDLLFRQFP